jgi:hypothetical protein
LSGAKAFIYVGSSSTAPTSIDGCEELYIVNASDADRVVLALDGVPRRPWRAVARDCFLAETKTREITAPSEKLLVDESIPQGGLLELHRI